MANDKRRMINDKRQMTRILYVSYWGGLEPLGQSLILPAVYKLSEMGAEMTVVTFDKPRDLENKSEIERVAKDMKRYNVNWISLRYHKRPRIPATLFDISHGVVRSILSRLKKRPDVIHARTFIGGLMGTTLANILRTKWIYHNEGFYPDEQVDGNFWAKDSKLHRITKSLELRMYGKADGLIVLSHRAKKVVEQMPEVERKKTPIIVIPSCVDLERFSWRETQPPNDKISLVYVGSMGGRYMVTEMARFAELARAEMSAGALHFRILSRTPREEANAWVEPSGLHPGAWSIQSVPYIEMPQHLTPHHAGMLFLRQGISEHGCSPTKFGEYWARGLPLLVTPNISDSEEIIRKEKVGVVVENHTDEAYKKAFFELRELLKDPELSLRCRRAAETHYALQPSCNRQMELYKIVMNNKQADSLIVSQSFE